MRPSRILLFAFALWVTASFAVVASQQPPATPPGTPPATPQAQPPKPTPGTPATAEPQKKNRFAMVEEEEEEEVKPPTQTGPRRFYSGTKACIKCHEKQTVPYSKGPHGKEWNERSPAADIGCETCHGPGKAHDEAPAIKGLIRNFTKANAIEASETCLNCHERGKHSEWQGSTHDARNVTCVNCHSVHKPKSEHGSLKEATLSATCGQCHAEKAAKMRRSSHMPVVEGKMDCSTCHNAHGSTNVRLLRSGNSVNEFCASCHAEKRGPYLWEHAPVTEGCTTCHDAHGSSNESMLQVRAPMLCQRCHVATRHPATPYDGLSLATGSNRLINRSCANCHSTLHGSNHPSGMFFMR